MDIIKNLRQRETPPAKARGAFLTVNLFFWRVDCKKVTRLRAGKTI